APAPHALTVSPPEVVVAVTVKVGACGGPVAAVSQTGVVIFPVWARSLSTLTAGFASPDVGRVVAGAGAVWVWGPPGRVPPDPTATPAGRSQRRRVEVGTPRLSPAWRMVDPACSKVWAVSSSRARARGSSPGRPSRSPWVAAPAVRSSLAS